MFSIDVNTGGRHGHTVVRLRGQPDATDAVGVNAVLAGVVACHPDIIIDCGGLRALAGVREQARRAGGGLRRGPARSYGC
jgi:hypothetical protein